MTHPTAIIRFPSAVEVRHKVDRCDCETRVSVDCIWVEYARGLIGSVSHRRP